VETIARDRLCIGDLILFRKEHPYRCCGIAADFLTTAFVFLHGGGASVLTAKMDSRNRAASRLLRRFGFEITSPKDPVMFRKDFSSANAFLRHEENPDSFVSYLHLSYSSITSSREGIRNAKESLA